MEAEVRVTAEQKAETLAVPKKAVFAEDLDDEQRFVYLAVAGKEPVKRTVAVGRTNDELVEITAGLAVGEEILLEKPAAAKPAETAKETAKADAPKEPAAADATKPAAADKPTEESSK